MNTNDDLAAKATATGEAHSPLPWEVGTYRGEYPAIYTANIAAIERVAKIDGSYSEERDAANAALIVEAVNNHTRLTVAVATLRSNIKALTDTEPVCRFCRKQNYHHDADCPIPAARSALKATE